MLNRSASQSRSTFPSSPSPQSIPSERESCCRRSMAAGTDLGHRAMPGYARRQATPGLRLMPQQAVAKHHCHRLRPGRFSARLVGCPNLCAPWQVVARNVSFSCHVCFEMRSALARKAPSRAAEADSPPWCRTVQWRWRRDGNGNLISWHEHMNTMNISWSLHIITNHYHFTIHSASLWNHDAYDAYDAYYLVGSMVTMVDE